MDAEIIYDNGERFKLSDLSVEVTDFKVSSMVKQSVYEDIEGANRVDYGAEYKHRTISIPFVMEAYDLHDFAHLRNEIFAKVDSLESFYIREMRRPIRRQYEFVGFNEKPKEREGTNNQYVDGKQYRVRLVNVIEIEQRGVKGVGELVFETTESPYAQSVYTTLDLHDSGYSTTAEKYGLVDNIDDEKVKYRFKNDTQTIAVSGWNDGGIFPSNGEVNDSNINNIYSNEITVEPGMVIDFEDLNNHPNINFWRAFEYNGSTFIRVIQGSPGTNTVSFTATGNRIRFSTSVHPNMPVRADNVGVDVSHQVGNRITTTNFKVYNARNVTIRPENMRLNIIARYVHSSGNFTIRNKTTGEEIVLQRESNGSHFRINGMIISLGNIMNIFRDTNRRFISLAPGDNEFEILNGTFDEINFDFKYYYK